MTTDHAESCDFAAMAAPTAEHERLEPFAGTFTAEVKMWMGPGDPHCTTGRMTNTFALGGRFLQQDYQGDAQEGPFPDFAGHGFWGFNKATQKWEGFWIDSASTAMQNESGDLDAAGRVWTMTSNTVNPMTGDPMTKKSVITLDDADHHTMEMFFIDPSGQEFKGMEIKYARTT